MKHLKGLKPAVINNNYVTEAGQYEMVLKGLIEVNDRMNDRKGTVTKERDYEDVTEQVILDFETTEGQTLSVREHLRGFVTEDQREDIDWGKYEKRVRVLDTEYDRHLCVIKQKKGEFRVGVANNEVFELEERCHTDGVYRVTDMHKTEAALGIIGQLFEAVGFVFDGESMIEDLEEISASGLTMMVDVVESDRKSKKGNAILEIKSINAVQEKKASRKASHKPAAKISKAEEDFYGEEEEEDSKPLRKKVTLR